MSTLLLLNYTQQKSSKLSNFIHTNMTYDALKALVSLPTDMFQEKAHVLGRLGRHREAIEILSQHSFALSKDYCLQSLDTDAYSILYDVCRLKYVNESFQFLLDFGAFVDPSLPLKELDGNLSIKEIELFLIKNTLSLSHNHSSLAINHSLISKICSKLKSQFLDQRSFVLDEHSMCRICLKRLSSNVFTGFKDGSLAHSYCTT